MKCGGNHHKLLHKGGSQENLRDERQCSTGLQKPHHFIKWNVNAPSWFPKKEKPCQSESSSSEEDVQRVFVASVQSERRGLAWRIVPLQLLGKNGQKVDVNALLDDGAEVNVLDEKVARQLKIDGKPSKVALSGLGNVKPQDLVRRATVRLMAPCTGTKAEINVCLSTTSVGGLMPMNVENLPTMYPHLKHLKISKPFGGKRVQMIIGNASPHLISALSPDVVGKAQEPVGRTCALGVTVAGPVSEGPPPRNRKKKKRKKITSKRKNVDAEQSLLEQLKGVQEELKALKLELAKMKKKEMEKNEETHDIRMAEKKDVGYLQSHVSGKTAEEQQVPKFTWKDMASLVEGVDAQMKMVRADGAPYHGFPFEKMEWPSILHRGSYQECAFGH